jgi:uncharacterized protein (DUF1800 family)
MFVERPKWHDYGLKTVLGYTGSLDGQTVLEQIVAQPQAAVFITAKIWNFFAGELPSAALNQALADGFRRSGDNFKPLVRAMFLSEEFYSPTLVRNQVKSPVQWLVGSVRMLETEMPPPLVSINLIRSLGQDLFAPPNVKGWDGGLSWISTNTLLARYNEAEALIQGNPSPVADSVDAKNPNQARAIQFGMRRIRMGAVDVDRILPGPQRANKKSLIAALEQRLLQSKLNEKQESALREYLERREDPSDQDIRGAIRLIMSTPGYQLA